MKKNKKFDFDFACKLSEINKKDKKIYEAWSSMSTEDTEEDVEQEIDNNLKIDYEKELLSFIIEHRKEIPSIREDKIFCVPFKKDFYKKYKFDLKYEYSIINNALSDLGHVCNGNCTKYMRLYEASDFENALKFDEWIENNPKKLPNEQKKQICYLNKLIISNKEEIFLPVWDGIEYWFVNYKAWNPLSWKPKKPALKVKDDDVILNFLKDEDERQYFDGKIGSGWGRGIRLSEMPYKMQGKIYNFLIDKFQQEMGLKPFGYRKRKRQGTFLLESWSAMETQDIEDEVENELNDELTICKFKDPEVYKAFEKFLGHPITYKEAEEMTEFDVWTFHCNDKIKSFDEFAEYFPNVEKIKNFAFNYCENLLTIFLPKSLKKIESYAFVWCKNLPSIEIPNTVENIGKGIFENCFRLKNIEYRNKNYSKISDFEDLFNEQGMLIEAWSNLPTKDAEEEIEQDLSKDFIKSKYNLTDYECNVRFPFFKDKCKLNVEDAIYATLKGKKDALSVNYFNFLQGLKEDDGKFFYDICFPNLNNEETRNYKNNLGYTSISKFLFYKYLNKLRELNYLSDNKDEKELIDFIINGERGFGITDSFIKKLERENKNLNKEGEFDYCITAKLFKEKNISYFNGSFDLFDETTKEDDNYSFFTNDRTKAKIFKTKKEAEDILDKFRRHKSLRVLLPSNYAIKLIKKKK